LFYLINDLGFNREDCDKAWVKAQKHFPSYNPKSIGDLLTLEVATRDILRGEFRPEIAEVEFIGGECQVCHKPLETEEDKEMKWCKSCVGSQAKRDEDWK